jgi:hypothetical protein
MDLPDLIGLQPERIRPQSPQHLDIVARLNLHEARRTHDPARANAYTGP